MDDTRIARDSFPIVSDTALYETAQKIDAAVGDILAAGKAKEDAHANRKELLRERAKVDTEIKLVEADAFMSIQGVGKEAFVMIGDKKTYLANEQARDAYARMSSKNERRRLAELDSEIAAIDADIAKINEGWNAKREACELIKAKANVQAALLNYLR